MHFIQTTLALALAASAAALPTANGGGSAPSGATCSSGSNYCFQSGKLTESQSQTCSTGDAYCCSSGSSDEGEYVKRGLLGDNALNCVSALNGATISLPISALKKRNGGGGGSQGPTCDSGSNYCYQSGKATWDQSQSCSTGDSYCCSSDGTIPIANCVNLLNNANVVVPVTILRKRWENEQPQGPTCSSGSNYCAQDGKFTEGQTQDCTTGNAYCCSADGGLLNCVNALNGLSVTVPVTIG